MPQHFHAFNDIKTQEIAPGFFSKLIHTEGQTINWITVAAGNKVPLHQHPHAQMSFVINGQFAMTIACETKVLDATQFCHIPGGTEHGGEAITDCVLVDIFTPVREDYQQLGGITL